jgi:PDZ domain-containing protein
VALFTEDPAAPARRGTRSGRVGWIVLAAALVIGLILAVVPAPYVIDKPGPVFNTLGSTDALGTTTAGAGTPLISIQGKTTYPTKGSLDLLTVSQVGSPEQRPTWLAVATAWLDPSEAVVPIDQAFPPNVSQKQVEQQNQVAMVNSQQDSIAAALSELGFQYPSIVTVVSLPGKSPAAGRVKPGDQVVSVNGTPVGTISQLRDALKQNGAGVEATLGVIRDGSQQTVTVTPKENGGSVVAGINVKMQYQFPFDVQIQLDKVGGPSAGMMFALGIIDKLTPGAIQGGQKVAGTGTIDQAGTVGPIGGIRQKLYAAKGAGAKWFLAPADNCGEVAGHIPDGLTVFAVKTLKDSLAALDAVRAGSGAASLPSCPSS